MKLIAKDIAAALLLILLFLISFAKEERERLLDWFNNASEAKKYVVAVSVAVFITSATAFIFGPSVWAFANMIFDTLNI